MKTLIEKLEALKVKIKSLADVEDLNDDQATELKDLMAQAENLQTQIKALEISSDDQEPGDDGDQDDEPITAAAVKGWIQDGIKAFAGEPKKQNTKVAPGQMKSAQLGDPDPVEDYYRFLATGEAKIKAHVNHEAELPFKYLDQESGSIKSIKVKAALQEGTDGEGGYLVPAQELGRIIEMRDEVALMPKVGAMQFTTDRDVFNIPTEGTALTKYTIVAEEGAITGAEEEPAFGQVAVTIYNFKKLIKVSEELLEDFNSGLDTFLNNALGRAWGITDNYYMQVGSGSSQPQGVFVGGTAGLTLDSASAIGAAEVPELMGTLTMAYRPGAVLLMARESLAYLAGLRDANDWAFRSAPIANLQSGAQDLGIGYPVFGTEDAATIAASAKSMLFGNFALYGWVRNRSLRVRRLVELYAGNGQVGILANFRAGGAVLQAGAFQYATHPTA